MGGGRGGGAAPEDRRGFGSITLPSRQGLPCRFDCGVVFSHVDAAVSIDGVLAAARARDLHELHEHGRVFLQPTPVPRRRRHLVYGKAVGAE